MKLREQAKGVYVIAPTPFHPDGRIDESSEADGVSTRFFEAGHILGSAAVSLEIEEKGRKVRLWFSGDIGPTMVII